MQKHTELINVIAEKIKAKKYLEIGVFNPEHNLNRINVEIKISVDPNVEAGALYCCTSDEYFEKMERIKSHLSSGHDIVFIDGLHHTDQVKKDLINSWKCLNEKGIILIHDTNPHSEHITHVPRDNREWCGDVYKTICQIETPDLFTLKDDYGVTVLRKTGELKLNDDAVTWEEFDLFRNDILNLKTWDECVKIIEGWE